MKPDKEIEKKMDNEKKQPLILLFECFYLDYFD